MAIDEGTLREVAEQNARIKRAAEAQNAAALPETVTAGLADGVYRSEVQEDAFSVVKEGDKFFVVKPEARKISRALGAEELGNVLGGAKE